MPRKFKFKKAKFSKTGKVQKIRIPRSDGTYIEIVAKNPNAGIPPGHLMQIADDPRSLRVLRIDPRFDDMGPV